MALWKTRIWTEAKGWTTPADIKASNQRVAANYALQAVLPVYGDNRRVGPKERILVEVWPATRIRHQEPHP